MELATSPTESANNYQMSSSDLIQVLKTPESSQNQKI